MPAPTSNSSVSPARRFDHHRSSFPFSNPSSTNPFAHPHPLQSPQSYNGGFGQPGMYATPAAGRRTRGAAQPHRHSTGNAPSNGVLPTPDPTVGSCMSEEDKDVALQLMRLGDMSNISHGRTSASTLDDTFSGRADAASSTGATSESESDDELPPARRQKREHSPVRGSMRDLLPSQDATEMSVEETQDDDFDPGHSSGIDQPLVARALSKTLSHASQARTTASARPAGKSSHKSKHPRPAALPRPKKATSVSLSKTPGSPARTGARKASAASDVPLADDEEDLSSKPRCQRCRKSKKGCDRQRPCQRCKDAGLSAEQCISEDEGNGRKGRYGRHMGVTVKKDELALAGMLPGLPGLPGLATTLHDDGDVDMHISAGSSPDKGKKRKR